MSNEPPTPLACNKCGKLVSSMQQLHSSAKRGIYFKCADCGSITVIDLNRSWIIRPTITPAVMPVSRSIARSASNSNANSRDGRVFINDIADERFIDQVGLLITTVDDIQQFVTTVRTPVIVVDLGNYIADDTNAFAVVRPASFDEFARYILGIVRTPGLSSLVIATWSDVMRNCREYIRSLAGHRVIEPADWQIQGDIMNRICREIEMIQSSGVHVDLLVHH